MARNRYGYSNEDVISNTYAAPSQSVTENISNYPSPQQSTVNQPIDRSNPPPQIPSTSPRINYPEHNTGTVLGAVPQQQQQQNEGSSLNREQYRDKWMSSGAGNLNDLKNFLAQYGGTLLGDNATVRTPFGEVLDMLFGAKGQAAGLNKSYPTWTGVNTGYAAPNNLPNSINNTINNQVNNTDPKTNYAAARPSLEVIRRMIEQGRARAMGQYLESYR